MSEKITAADLERVINRNREIQQENAVDNYQLMQMESEEVSWHIPYSQLGFLLLQKRGLILFPVEDPNDSQFRAAYVQKLIDDGYPVNSVHLDIYIVI